MQHYSTKGRGQLYYTWTGEDNASRSYLACALLKQWTLIFLQAWYYTKCPKAKSIRVKIHTRDAIRRAFILLLVARMFKRPALLRKRPRSNREWIAGTKHTLTTGPTDDSLRKPLQRGLSISQISFCVYFSHVPFYRSHSNGNQERSWGYRDGLHSAPPTK